MDVFGFGGVGDALLFNLLITIAFQLSCFVIAFAMKFDKITDLAGCVNFIAIALVSLLTAPAPYTTRQIVLTSLVCVSRFELGSFLFYRVLKRGRDARFDEVRENCAIFLFFCEAFQNAVAARIHFLNPSLNRGIVVNVDSDSSNSIICCGFSEYEL